MMIRRATGAALAVLAALAGSPAVAQTAGGFDPREMRAQLVPQRHATLSAEIGAKVKRLALKDGQSFRSGDVLLEFDCALQAAQLEKAAAQQSAAENLLDGQRTLAKLKAAGMVEVRTAEAEVTKAKADVTYLKTVMSKCRIAAPYDGRVVEHKVSDQQFVQPGQPLLEIIDDNALELEFIVPSSWLAFLKPGHAFAARIEDTGRDYPVRLLRTAARVDPVSQSVKAVAVIDGTFPELVAGMSGHILLTPPAGH